MREGKILRYGWRFQKGDFPDACNIEFDDSKWETVRVPHDWAISGPFDQENDSKIISFVEKGEKKQVKWTGETGGLPHAGKAWYRLEINLEKKESKRFRIEFDGVMNHSKIFWNGNLAGFWPYGYSSFAFDVTDYVKNGKNVLAVFVDNKEHASRWYPGAGIYRNVRLVIMNPVHVSHWGTYITTPSVNSEQATINIKTEIENHTGKKIPVELETHIISPEGKIVASKTNNQIVEEKFIFENHIDIASPALWSVESPNLYTAKTVVKVNGENVDCYETRFGIRTIKFDSEYGFFLNEKPMKFKGVCLHHDLGALGTAINKAAIKRQLNILKEMGCNAIRTSHNPPAPELLELADEMGFLVIDEAFDEWKIPKGKNGYNLLFDQWAEKDLRAMIKRDRNHPCVIMWSIGNEIPEQKDPYNGAKIAKFLYDICKSEDPTRPVTSAINIWEDAIKNGFVNILDVIGWNYAPCNYGRYHQLLKGKPMFGSETASCISTRGEYYFPVEEEPGLKRSTLQVNSFDLSYPEWANIPDVEFRAQDDHPFIMGEFVWTGFDYLGEPTPYFEEWPSRSSYFGIVDLAGIPKDRYYLYQSRWADKKTLHIVPHWTWHGYEGKMITVQCYSSWDIVEIFVNGKSYGIKKKLPKSLLNRYRLIWNVVYQPGELKAIAYDNDGNPVKETIVKTAGKPSQIRLIPDKKTMKADGDDMIFVCVEILDEKDVVCPDGENLVYFYIEGPAEIAGVDNGNPISLEPFQTNYRKAFHGKCTVILRSIEGKKGTIKLVAQSRSLKEAEIKLEST